MITSIQNQQKKHPIQPLKIKALAEYLAKKLQVATAPEPWNEVCLVLVDDEGITQTNCEYFGKNRPTDVISFRYDPIPGEDEGWSGDLVINVDRAVHAGPEHNGIDYELALYIAHGFDHLSGAEDDTDEKREAMRATETEWLLQAGALIEDLLSR